VHIFISKCKRLAPQESEKTMASEAVLGTLVDFQACWTELDLPAQVREVLGAAPLVQTPETRQQLLDWALGRG
jgi:hypothetical protein